MITIYMKKIVIASLLAFISFATAHSQTTVRGTVVDSQQIGVPYAAVKVLNMDSTFVKGVATDSVGHFDMEIANDGNYILLISCIGYTSYSQVLNIHKDETNIQKITLKNDAVALNEVVIRGNKLVRKEDKFIIIPDQQIVKHTFGGYVCLRT